MIVAITGASGFIGRRLVDHHRRQGDEVRVLTRRPPARDDAGCFVADLTTATPDDLVPFVEGAHVLYHCAGEIRDPARMESLHVRGTETLIAAAAGRIGRWVQLSSVGVYGPQWRGTVTEETAEAPVGPYEVTKAASDARVEAAHRAGRISAVVLRPSIVFAADMPNDALRAMVRMLRAGLFAYMGTPGASANYVHADDVVSALVLCATAPGVEGRVYNLSDWCTVEAFVGALADGAGVRRPWLRLPLPLARLIGAIGDRVPGVPLTRARVDALSNRARYATHRIETELGYTPHVPLPEALQTAASAWRAP